MKISEPLKFDDTDREDIYDYVERRGEVDLDEAQKDLFPYDEKAFLHHLSVLKRRGYLREEDGVLRVEYETGEDEVEYEVDGLSFAIRPATDDDVDELVEAIRSVADERRYIVAESVAEQVDHEEVLFRHNEIKSRMFLVAEVEDDIVGWAHISAPEFEKLRHTAELTFGVVDEHRGHGIGSKLLDRALRWGNVNGYEKLYNSVPATNEEAIEYLKERGCEVEAVREDHYRIDGDYVDEVMLAVRPGSD
ncbi:MAG: GNAT family N-acetyltransferase [Halobacteria archaeon]|nr:GNAT family N-acetyltransferase [Halobacteria archaeon]